MLGVQIHALRLGAAHLGRAEFAGKEPVLGKVFKVAARKRRAVDIHARRVQADDAVRCGLLPEHLAEFLHKRFIPRRADDDLARERNAAQRADQRVDARRAVQIARRGLADARNRRRRPAAVQNHRSHVLVGKLFKKLFPLRIVPIQPRHVGQRQAVIRIDDRGIGGVDFVRRFFTERLHDRVGSRLAVRAGGRGRARPVGAGGIDRDLAVLHVGKVRDGGGLIGRARMAFAIGDRLLHRISAAVDHSMRVVHQLDFVVPGFKHIAARAERVERRHILRFERNRHGLGFVRRQFLGLGKADQSDMRLLNAALGVRRGIVNLHHILARDAAGVGDLHLHRNRTVAVGIARDLLREGRVAQAIAERVLHSLFVVDKAVCRRRLIVAIADVDALGVFDIVALEVAVGKVARVPIRRRGGQVIRVGIDEPTGGIDRTGKHFADCIKADRAGAADPNARVHAVRKTKLHRVRRVDEHDHLAEALRFNEVQKVFLVLRQLQIMPSVVGLGIARREHIHRQVAALTADAGEHDDRHVRKVLRLLQNRIGIGGSRDLGRREIRAGIAALLGPGYAGILIELHKFLIDNQSCVLKALHDIHVLGRIARAGACAAVDRIHRAVAEQVDLRTARKRQRGVVVLQQHDTLGLQRFCHLHALLGRVGNRQDLRRRRRLAARDHRVKVNAHPCGDHGIEACACDIHRQRRDKQDRDCNDLALAPFLHVYSSVSVFFGKASLSLCFDFTEA